jgi:hypothetical protein
MSFYKEENSDFYPMENYESLRKTNTVQSEVIIPYKPATEPAWSKHNNNLPPKPQRFSKLNRWDRNCNHLQTAVKWAVVAAGAATIAGPVLMRLPH